MISLLLIWLLTTPSPVNANASADCARCHESVHEAWAVSSHGRSHDNPAFLASYAKHRSPWCHQCHSPTGRGEGITCVTCHVDDDVVITHETPKRKAKRAHAMRVDPALGTSEFCATCHQFDAPIRRPGQPTVFESGTPMQNTFAEWRASSYAESGTQCQSCHDHSTQSALDDHIAVDVNENAVTVSIREMGHRFPTGDPFRQLRVELLDSDGALVDAAVFARIFEDDGDGGYRVAKDTTVAPDSSRTLSVKTEGAVAWRLVYHLSEVDIGPATQRVVSTGDVRF